MDTLINAAEIFALYAEPEGDCGTIHAISLNKDTLNDILNNQVPEEYKQMVKFVIKPIQVYLLIKFIEIEKANKIFKCFGTNKDLTLMPSSQVNINTFKNKMFGFNKKINNGDYIQSILIISNDNNYESEEYKKHLEYVKEQDMFKNEISENQIMFDTYYDESIMNA
jgi:hypothetical protein